MSKRIFLLIGMFFVVTSCFAQTARTALIRTVDEDYLREALRQQLQIATLSPAMQQQVKIDIQNLASASAQPVAQPERCGEGNHTRSQAKNHKGPCSWPSEQPSTAQKSASILRFDSETNQFVFITATGKVWVWSKRRTLFTSLPTEQQDTTQTSARQRISAHW